MMTEQLMGIADTAALERDRTFRELQSSWLAKHPVETVVVHRDRYGEEDPKEPDWQDKALCLKADPEIFFRDNGSSREANRTCLQCEVRTECKEYALENEEEFGFWAGTSARQRRKLKNRGA